MIENKTEQLCYGYNPVTEKNVYLNRKELTVPHGMVIGDEDIEKINFINKEILNVADNTHDKITIIQKTENKYNSLLDNINGVCYTLKNNADICLNVLDAPPNLDMDFYDSFVFHKISVLVSLYQLFYLHGKDITASEMYMISECCKEVYRPYFKSYDKDLKEFDRNKVPTLVDFLLTWENKFPNNMFTPHFKKFKNYVLSSLKCFSSHTNIKYMNNSVELYDVSNLYNENINDAPLLLITECLWNKIYFYKPLKYRRLYIEGLDTLFVNDEILEPVANIWSQADRYRVIMTGICENAENLYKCDISKNYWTVTSFICILSIQQPLLDKLSHTLLINDKLKKYLEKGGERSALLDTGVGMVPIKF